MMIFETLKGPDICFPYLDDIIIYSKSTREHLVHIRQVFDCLHRVNIKLTLIKCDFFKPQIHYLWYSLLQEGISPLAEKIDTITFMPSTKMSKTQTVLRVNRLIQKLHQSLCWYHSHWHISKENTPNTIWQNHTKEPSQSSKDAYKDYPYRASSNRKGQKIGK